MDPAQWPQGPKTWIPELEFQQFAHSLNTRQVNCFYLFFNEVGQPRNCIPAQLPTLPLSSNERIRPNYSLKEIRQNKCNAGAS